MIEKLGIKVGNWITEHKNASKKRTIERYIARKQKIEGQKMLCDHPLIINDDTVTMRQE